LVLELVDAAVQVIMSDGHAAQTDKRSHDLHVHMDRASAPEDAGEHRDPLLGERIGRVATAAAGV